MKEYSFSDIENLLEAPYKIVGNQHLILFNKALPLNQGDEKSLCWLSLSSKNKEQFLTKTKAQIILCDSDEQTEKYSGKIFIKVKNPRLIYARIIKNLFIPKMKYGIHPTAIIDENAVIAKETFIGPNTVIGNCNIGRGTIIYGNCFLFDNTTIGENVTIMPNTTIGGTGFGYEKNAQGEFELFPHIGGVQIDNNVDIGSNTCIDRGTLGNTIIGSGSKIDNLVHIAHNVIIGKNCAVIAHAMIGGSTVIYDNSWIAPSACLRDGIIIGKNAIVGLGAVVVKNIPENETWMGNPAKKYESKK